MFHLKKFLLGKLAVPPLYDVSQLHANIHNLVMNSVCA